MVPRNGDAVATLDPETKEESESDKTSGRRRRPQRSAVKRFLHENGLSLAAFALFALCLIGQFVTGLDEYNNEQREHRQPTIGPAAYVRSGHFIEATFENWESEFVQLAAFVVLTAMLRQKGSPESKKLDEEGEKEVDKDPRHAVRSSGKRAHVPWPVRRGGIVLTIYEHSLSLALGLLFVMSFVLHAIGGAAHYNEQLTHRGETVTALTYVGTTRFWFESFQNWQSEFLAVGALFVLTIWLRERGSPKSKPVAAANDETGS